MVSYQVDVTSVINAPPVRVYRVIADYRIGHPAILPEHYFTGLEVIEGGHGEGTVIDVSMRVFGATSQFRLVVTEPEPGHILREVDPNRGSVTTFTVDPRAGGSRSHVTISTTMPARPGIRGWLEKLVTAPIMRRIYREQLQMLETVARSDLATSQD